MKKHKIKAIDYFKRHHRNECFITSDGRIFHQEGPANSFAITLKDRTVEHYTRTEVEKDLIQEQMDNDSTTHTSITEEEKIESKQNVGEEHQDEKAKRTAELLALELVSKNYNEMLSMVKFFGLEVKDKKADSLIAALAEYKSKLEA